MLENISKALAYKGTGPRTMKNIRDTRDVLLKNSDWTQMPDSPLSPEKKQEWAAYRQALRDLPESGDVNNIAWPQKP